ncbi:transcriptional regulator domain-containing protein [Sinorhizobium saheli]|uniref:Transcriptional regulator-like domain-containing protein n=2 Tax=Sinorhizobium saheli TaxID=36856 RepID=A0A178Y6U6_SINSA|nr:DUF6499 domain-containing protein [Sinorhizobium saheli]MQW87859.1 hypothetical protein [Sinorhizobium saheli]OAP43064.1 hypothetical protein ATB98_15565 [Sinorhizobium saheli]
MCASLMFLDRKGLPMEPLEDWRSPKFEEELGRLDRGGISFEFLRRNGEYRARYKAATDERGKDAAALIAAREGLTRQWGLTFPS